jgi:deoxyguanosine kinase
MLIAIEGWIGAGKTTTATICSEHLGYELLLERTEAHPFLFNFYADPDRYAIETELGFVLIHYHQLHPLEPSISRVSDFSPVKDLIYAEMNLSGVDSELFGRVYTSLSSRIRTPDLVIYLNLAIDELMRRIRERARSYEMYVPQSYIERLVNGYETHMSLLGNEVRVLNVRNGESREEVADSVMALVLDYVSKRPLG